MSSALEGVGTKAHSRPSSLKRGLMEDSIVVQSMQAGASVAELPLGRPAKPGWCQVRGKP